MNIREGIAPGSTKGLLRMLLSFTLAVAVFVFLTGGSASAARKTATDANGNVSVVQDDGTGKLPSAERNRPAFRPDEVLVKFKPGVSDAAARQKHRHLDAEVIRSHKRLRLHQVRLKKGMTVEEAVARYQTDPDVEYAEPNYRISTQGVPNDTRYGEQWGLGKIKAPLAWDLTTGSSDAVIAILDTGIDYTHPDLVGNLWVNSAEQGGQPGIDDDGNGYVDDLYGYNAVNNTGDPRDDYSHGTHVAGIIGAVGNNAAGVAGVAWNVKLMACKFISSNGYGYISDAIECLQYVRTMKDRGVNIVATNNSWGGSGYSQALYDAIGAQKDILFVAAAGNDNSSATFYPAGYDLPNIVSVAASDSSDQKASFSNYNKWAVDIAAPGSYILSTYPGSAYQQLSGTSMAAPHVAGLAALLGSQDGTRNAAVLKNLIIAGRDPVPAFSDITVSGGRINAYRSLTCSDTPFFAVLHAPQAPQPGVPQTISAQSINCGTSLGPVSATLSGGEVIELRDDGQAPDLVAGDGIFTGTWTPTGSAVESLTFNSPAGTVAVSAPPVAIGEPPAVSATSILLPDSVTSAATNTPFSQGFPLSGGVPPFSWSLIKGSLPAGLTLNTATGEISGTPTAAGIFAVTLQVSDALGVKDRKDWTLLLNDGIRAGWPRELERRSASGFLPASHAPVFADLDGDGRDEIIVTQENTLYLFRPDGTMVKTVLPGPVSTPAVADLDGDGVKEIIVSVETYYTSTNSIYAFHADLTPVAGFPAGGYDTVNGGPGFVTTPVVADFNNDGHLAIAVVASPNNIYDPNYQKNFVIMVDSQGRMVPGWPQFAGSNNNSGDAPLAVGDLDRDGKQELVMTTIDGLVTVFRPDGTQFGQWRFAPSLNAFRAPILADLDGDGFLDIVIKYHDTADAVTVLNRNGETLAGWPRVFAGSIPSDPVAADIDGDGKPEILFVSGTYANELQALRGDGSSLPNWPAFVTSTFGVSAPAVVADLDGDGRQEVLVPTYEGTLFAYDADANVLPGFPKYTSPSGTVGTAPAIGDFDGNGKLDFALKNESGYLYLWEMPEVAGGKELQWPMYRNDAAHSGAWVAPRLTVTPGVFDFQGVEIGTASQPHAFTIQNPRYDNVTVSALQVTGADSSQFGVSAGSCGAVPFTLAPLQSCSVDVVFTPSGAGTKSALLTVSAAGGRVLAANSRLSGTGTLPTYSLGYTRLGGGSGTVTSSTGTSFSQSGSEAVPVGMVVTLSAVASADSVFTGWEGACTGTGDCTVTMDGNKQVSATFESVSAGIYRLDILRSGPGASAISYTPGGSCPAQCSHLYGAGSVVNLTPSLSTDSVFTGWSGCDSVSGTVCTVTVSADRSVTANYKSILAVTSGIFHSVAIQVDGTVWGWGNNGWGQLGDGTKNQRKAPIKIPGLSDIVSVSSRSLHSAALKSDGTVWTWGYNAYGQIGDGTTNQRLSPGQVPGFSGVVAVAAGDHTVALKQDGTVWAWGNNDSGQLGDGTTTRQSSPEQVPGLSGVVSIAAGISFTVALKGDGTVWTWGNNQNSELGDGTWVSYRATPAKITGISGVVAIRTGRYHTLALKNDGTLWAWGYDNFGELGDGLTYSTHMPVRVKGVSGVTEFGGGAYHSLASYPDGTVAAWGRNDYGQLGDGSTTQHITATQVPGLTGVVSVASGENFSSAVKGDGSIWQWGSNANGELGDGTTVTRYAPVQLESVNLAVSTTYAITATAGYPGTIVGPGIVSQGCRATYLITVPQGYHVADVVVDGASVGAVASYTFSNVSSNHTIAATFAINSYTITATAGPHGSITGPASVNYGWSAAYTITPATGYHVADVVVDGVSVGALTSYTFVSVKADHTIAATFAINSYTIAATAGANGSITGPAGADYGGSAQYTMTPAAGYHVADVLVDGTSVGAVTSYSFNNVTANHTISVSFAINTYRITATTGGNGSVTGPATVSYGGSADYLITPATGYHVADVVVDGASVGAVTSYSFTSVAADHTIAASFAINSYTITASAGANGSISGPATVNYGGTASYTVTAAAGYHVADLVVDGASVGALTGYSFSNVTADHTVSASFAINTYSITVSAGANGSISGPATVTFGGSASYTITAAAGYHVADVLVDGVSAGAVTSYSFSNVAADHTIAASFAINTYSITASPGANGSITGPATVNYGGNATYSITGAVGYHVVDVVADGVSVGAVTSYSFVNVTADHAIGATFAINTYSITASAGANGSVSGPATVNYGSSASYTFSPAQGYHVADVVVDGASVGAPTSYTFTNVAGNHTIGVTFAINTYSIGATSGGNGTITGPATVTYGASANYSITPAVGYHILDVAVDGTSVGAVSSYSFTNVTASHTIAASFAVNTYSITASAGANGSISGPATVAYGGSATYAITPAAGYSVADVLVDGISAGAVTSYSFTNVTAGHTISATFAAQPDLTVTSVPTPPNTNRGSTMNVSATVANQAGNAGTFTVAFYLSKDKSINSGDILLGTKPVASLNAGSTTTVSGSFTVPSSMATGKYYLVVMADSTNAIAETNEGNNTLAAGSTTSIR